jgi:hypothetical protein
VSARLLLYIPPPGTGSREPQPESGSVHWWGGQVGKGYKTGGGIQDQHDRSDNRMGDNLNDTSSNIEI